MMIRFGFIWFFAFSGIVSAYAQDAYQSFIFEHRLEKFREIKPEFVYSTIEGNAYYTDNFVESTIYFTSGDSIIVPVRYDLYADEIEFNKDKNVLWVHKGSVDSILYGNDKLTALTMLDGKTIHYFFIINNGKYSLLQKKRVKMIPAELPKGFQDAKPPRFEPVEEYYIKKNDLPPVAIYTKKDINRVVAGNPLAQDFVKKEKIRLGREDDLVKLVEYLNSQPE